MKPNFKLHPNGNVSDAINRINEHIRAIQRNASPKTGSDSRQQFLKAKKPKLRLVKK